VTVVLGPEDFRRQFVTLANPSNLLEVYHGKYGGWAQAVLADRRQPRELPLIGPLIDTSLGVTPARGYLLRTDPAAELLGHWNFDAYLATAGIWPSADVGDEFRREARCEIPVLFAQGDWDVQTPIENLLEVTPYFPHARTLRIERGGHGALREVLARQPEASAALVEFLRSGNVEKLPARVTLPAPRFDLPDVPLPDRDQNRIEN
jgi:pimeloyl-ACP methyl ester carboxylesterase